MFRDSLFVVFRFDCAGAFDTIKENGTQQHRRERDGGR